MSDVMEMELVHRDDRAGSAVLVLDSPANRNALSKALVTQLSSHLADVAADRSVRAVALTATGKTFCSGADLTDPPVQQGPGSFADVLAALWEFPKPVVVAINGHVRAGGFGLVSCADVAACSESATFALTEVRLGLVPAIISVMCLRRMTPGAAARYLLTGEQFGPAEAVEAGLVHTVVGPDDLSSELDAVLDQFRMCEPAALAATRELIRRVPQMDVASGLRYTQEVSEKFFASPEAAEGIASFKEKRPPSWAQ